LTFCTITLQLNSTTSPRQSCRIVVEADNCVDTNGLLTGTPQTYQLALRIACPGVEKLNVWGDFADSPNHVNESGLAVCAKGMAIRGDGVSSFVFRISWCWCVLLAGAGCTRTHYRLRADSEAHSILTEKSASTPWRLPFGFGVDPDPRSRFYDATPTDDPWLPVPAPQLYAYSLPDLPERDPSRFGGPLPTPNDEYEDGEELRLVAIPDDVWQSLPPNCLVRMFESASVREEYARTYGQEPSDDQRDQSQRLTLEDIVDLALINSREYQSQKETLYRAALVLSLERFDYDMKFATGGNRNEVNHSHSREAGITEDELRVPTTFTENALLATGGNLLAQFANRVVLTFNGPTGFAADIGSDLVVDFSQSIFQRDIVLEDLTQAERDVVYAARNFVRFRKQLFVDLAGRYYNLLLDYRDIEIRAQAYFGFLRGFLQGQAEYRAGRLPRFEVDQFEQRALSGRRDLINSCNSLEESLDDLKFDIGLPPELPLNLDLAELEQLMLRDEETAEAERVRRSRRNLLVELRETEPKQAALLNAAIDQVRKMLNLIDIRERLGQASGDAETLQSLLARLLVDEADLKVQENERYLTAAEQAEPRAQDLDIYWRTMDLVSNQAKATVFFGCLLRRFAARTSSASALSAA